MSSIQWIIAHCRENLTTLRRTRKRVTVLPREKHLNRDTDLWMTRVSQVARRFGKAQAVWQTGWPSLHTRMGRKPMQTLPRNFSPEHSLKILYCTKCFERRSPETIKPKLEDILCTVADHCTKFHSPTNEKSGECTNDVYACTFPRFCVFCEPWRAYKGVPQETLIWVLREWNFDAHLLLSVKILHSCSKVCVRVGYHNCSLCVLDFDKGICCHRFSSYSIWIG